VCVHNVIGLFIFPDYICMLLMSMTGGRIWLETSSTALHLTVDDTRKQHDSKYFSFSFFFFIFIYLSIYLFIYLFFFSLFLVKVIMSTKLCSFQHLCCCDQFMNCFLLYLFVNGTQVTWWSWQIRPTAR